jgi:hypothetical protein
MNKNVALQNANYERDVGEIDATQAGMKSRAELAQAKAGQGASGIDVNSESSTAVRESMIELGNYDQMMIRSNAARKAYGYEVEASEAGAQADLYRYSSAMNLTQKANALTAAGMTEALLPIQQQSMALAGQAGQLSAQGSMISAAGSVASKWIQGVQLFGGSSGLNLFG